MSEKEAMKSFTEFVSNIPTKRSTTQTPNMKLPAVSSRSSRFSASFKDYSPISHLSTEVTQESPTRQHSFINHHGQSRSFRLLSTKTRRSELNSICNADEELMCQDLPSSSEELYNNYNPKEAKYTHDSIGKINLPRKNFQIAEFKDALPTNYTSTLIKFDRTKVQQVENSLFKMIQPPAKPKKSFKLSLRSSLKQMKNLNIKSDDIWMLDTIVSKKPFDKPNARVFINACKDGNCKLVEKLLAQNKYLVHVFDSNGMTGIHWTALRNHTEIMKILLIKHAFVDVVDYVIFIQCNRTPLHLACKFSNIEAMQILKTYQANPMIFSSSKKLPAQFAKNLRIKKEVRGYMLVSSI